MNKILTKEELQEVEDYLPTLRQHLRLKAGRFTYEDFVSVHNFLNRVFKYKSDEYTFNKNDLWDTQAFDKAVLAYKRGGFVEDDCDGAGYILIEGIYRLCKVSKKRLRRWACAAETGEGHFVMTAQCDDGNVYQGENRTTKPRSMRYFLNLGYTYWYTSTLETPKIWYKADAPLGEILRNTPPNLEADAPDNPPVKAMLNVHTSRTLLKEWTTKLSGLVLMIAGAIPQYKQDLQAFLTPEVVGIAMVVSGAIGIYLRWDTLNPIKPAKGDKV